MGRILEHFNASGGSDFRVDEENGVIYGVKLLGRESENRRRYSDAALAKAAHLYENMGVFVDHRRNSKDSRSSYDKVAWIENVQNKGDAGVYGDLHIFKTHRFAPTLFECANRNSSQFGMSHDSFGKTRQQTDGWELVEDLRRVDSVDVVVDPASVKGLREEIDRSRQMGTATAGKRTRRQVILEHVHAPRLVKWLREFDDGGMLDMPADEPAGDAGAVPDDKPEHGKELFDAICAMVDEALDGADEEVFSAKYLGKLKKIQAICKDGSGGKDNPGNPGDDTPPPDESAAMEESRKLKAENGRLLRESQVRVLCDAEKFVPSAVQMKALVPLDDVEAKVLIESLKGQPQQAPSVQRPRSMGRNNDTGQAADRGAKDGQNKNLQESLKFEGDKAIEQRASFLRGNGV